MRIRLFSLALPTLSVATLIGSAVLLSSTDKPAFTIHEKAAFADPNLVDFVRPGLVTKINSASIAADGTIQVQFTITDPKGAPLDRAGVNTPGAVSTSFIASAIPSDQEYYVAYTTRTQTSPITKVSAVQPAADANGSYTQTGPGQYTYTFATKAPSNADRTATTSIGVYSSRDLTDPAFNLGTYFADDVFTFVPNGGPPPKTHQVINTGTCNKCHDPLQAHGGARQSLELCVLCHTQPAIDPDTGNSIQFRQMIHKIHNGAELPSVQAGKPYQIIGFNQSVSDFSDVEFPADQAGEGARNCQFCHEGVSPQQGQAQGQRPPAGVFDIRPTANTSGPPSTIAQDPGKPDVVGQPPQPGQKGGQTPLPPPPDAAWWLQRPSIEACGSCHDNVNFATGQNHAGGPQLNNNQCANCHFPQGELPFDASIIGAHTIPRFSSMLPGVVFTINSAQGQAGKSPVVTFTVKDNAGNPVDVSKLSFFNLVMAGPSSDYASVTSEDARSATASASGSYTYTFKAVLPADAKGTYTVGTEAYNSVTLLPGTEKQVTVRDVAPNVLASFSADGSPVSTHAIEVAQGMCDSCHYSLAAHGTIRNQVQYCLLCHNPNATDAALRPAAQNPPQSIDLPLMIHRIHSSGGLAPAADVAAGQAEGPYIVYGFGGSVNDFSDIAYQADLRDCIKCHVNDSQSLPLPAGRIQALNPRGFINPAGPTTVACMGCHNEKSTAAHAAANTDPNLGESCAVCHGRTAEFSVNRVHARNSP